MVAIPRKNSGAGIGALIVMTCIGLAAAGCGSSSSSSSSSTSGSSKPSGTANVAYASSIQYLNEKIVGPAFTQDEGYKYSGRSGASGDLGSEIAASVITPNTVESVGAHYRRPASEVSHLLGTADFGSASSAQVFAESALDATLQSGQLDASSAYLNQAIQLHLPYITLPAAINLGTAADKALYKKASVTITSKGKKSTKHGSPLVIDITIIGQPTAAGTAFVAYTLSSKGRAQYQQGGYTLITPTVFGDTSAIPASVKSDLGI